MQTLLLLALAGALGASARYALTLGIAALLPRTFPWAIFIVNVTGCALFGLIWELAAVRGILSDATRVILLVGFMGSFTTFSTLIFDCDAMLRQEQWVMLTCNLCGQVILGIAALRFGLWLARG